MSADAIYDYFTPIEDAIAQAFAVNQITCYTPRGLQELNDAGTAASPNNKQEFQKETPRVEIMLLPGASKGFLLPVAGRHRAAPGFLREQVRNASLTLRLITAANIVEHRAYVARVLFYVDTLGLDANAAVDAEGASKMPYHRIGCVMCNGGTLDYKPEEGNIETVLNCSVDFSVLDGAWELLN